MQDFSQGGGGVDDVGPKPTLGGYTDREDLEATEDRSCHEVELSENILCGGRHLFIWRPPLKLTGGRHLDKIFVLHPIHLSGGRHLNYLAAAR